MITALRLTAVSFLAASAVFCQIKDVQGWDKVKWGMSVAEVRAAYGSRASEPLAGSVKNDKLLISDIHIGEITASADIYTATNSDKVVSAEIAATGWSGITGSGRQSIFGMLKPLLIQKYGTPRCEDRVPDFDGGFIDSTLLWVFPSTSVKLRWSEDTSPGHNNGFVSIEYKAIDKKAVDAL